MYGLRALIATERVLRGLAGTDSTAPAGVVPLDQGLWMLPMTSRMFEAFGGEDDPDKFPNAPAELQRALASSSRRGPVAYVEAEYFGGTGTQSAQVWDGGTVVLGPLVLADDESPPTAGSPISRALRRLGVAQGNHHDEFDAVGLGRYRTTDDWLAPAVTRPDQDG